MTGHPLGNPAALWTMNEGCGNKIYDSSSRGNTGILTGTAPVWNSGKFGPAILLPGTNEYINITSIDVSGGLTYIIWVMFPSVPDGSMGLISNRKTMLAVNATALRWYADVDTGPKDYAVTWVAGKWYQLAATQFDTTYAMYMNGVLVKTGLTGVLDNTDANHYIGAYTNSLWFLDGIIDHVMICNCALCALSASEIQKLFYDSFCMFARRAWPVGFGAEAPVAICKFGSLLSDEVIEQKIGVYAEI